MSFFDIANWRLFTKKETLHFISERNSKKNKSDGSHNEPRGSLLGIRTYLKPIDIYSYLKSRFGNPNGTTNLLFAADSGNLVHWDYYIKAGDSDVIIHGLTREVQILVNEEITDPEWFAFFDCLKSEFARLGREKSNTANHFERWHVFQNKYAALASVCAELHGDIKEETEKEFSILPIQGGNVSEDARKARLEPPGERANRIYGKCTQLRLVMPIMAESFINLTVLILCTPKNRADPVFWEAYRETSFYNKVKSLHKFCEGFKAPINMSTQACREFMRIRSSRNDDIHGNHNPETDYVERVYFDGKVPLYETPGDNIQMFMKSMETLSNPQQAVDDYEAIMMFLIEIRNTLHQPIHSHYDLMIQESYPGYDVNRKILGKLFPEHVPHFVLQGTKFDDELTAPNTFNDWKANMWHG